MSYAAAAIATYANVLGTLDRLVVRPRAVVDVNRLAVLLVEFEQHRAPVLIDSAGTGTRIGGLLHRLDVQTR